MANFIHNISAHNTLYDISSDRAQHSHYTNSANYCVNDGNSTYHFSAANVGDIPLYDTTKTRVFNESVGEITPKFDSDDTIPAYILLSNNVENKSSTVVGKVVYSVLNKQSNYDVYHGTHTFENNGSMTEYQGLYNVFGKSNAMARVPFKFSVCLVRHNNVGKTPDFDNGKPLAKITSIYGAPLSSLYVKGPAYILGSCVVRPSTSGNNNAFPSKEYRVSSREMIFWMNLDETDSNYGSIYLCTSNCKLGNTKASAYHCSYTEEDCGRSHIELAFNTVLYVAYA